MMQGILSSILAIALVTSGNACAWICLDSMSAAHEELESHCDGESKLLGHSPLEPCESDCASCSLETAGVDARSPGLGEGPPRAPAVLLKVFAAPPSGRFSRGMVRLTDRSPPVDILSTTASLQL